MDENSYKKYYWPLDILLSPVEVDEEDISDDENFLVKHEEVLLAVKTFESIIKELMDNVGLRPDTFQGKTGLPREYYYRLIKPTKSRRDIRRLMTVIVQLAISFEFACYLLSLQGLSLRVHDDVEFAYLQLLMYCGKSGMGMDIINCNNMLCDWGVPDEYLLGDRLYDK